jgi:hypothetical protein
MSKTLTLVEILLSEGTQIPHLIMAFLGKFNQGVNLQRALVIDLSLWKFFDHPLAKIVHHFKLVVEKHTLKKVSDYFNHTTIYTRRAKAALCPIRYRGISMWLLIRFFDDSKDEDDAGSKLREMWRKGLLK